MKRLFLLAALAGIAILAIACGDDDDSGDDDDDDDAATEANGDEESLAQYVQPSRDYNPEIDPANFVEAIDNPYFPLIPGSTWAYEGETDEGRERIEVEVLDETREVMGITATVVRDQVFLEGDLIEDTFDWYAQDSEGNVWYLGEETEEIEDGEVVSTEGSWEAGVDGALPGIVMPAEPEVGVPYYQEFYEGEAEDYGTVLAVGESVDVEFGSFEDCLRTEDINPFEPDVVEHKTYCPDVGFVLEVKVEGGEERIELVEAEVVNAPA